MLRTCWCHCFKQTCFWWNQGYLWVSHAFPSFSYIDCQRTWLFSAPEICLPWLPQGSAQMTPSTSPRRAVEGVSFGADGLCTPHGTFPTQPIRRIQKSLLPLQFPSLRLSSPQVRFRFHWVVPLVATFLPGPSFWLMDVDCHQWVLDGIGHSQPKNGPW